MRARFDDSEVTGLFRVIVKAEAGAQSDVAAIVKRGAQNIKDDARRRAPQGGHARRYPSSITYDTYQSLTGPAADVGPDKGKPQGPLGNILEFGSPTSGPHPHMRPAAEAELPKFGKQLEDLAVRALEGR